MTDWTETELSALRRAYASGTTRVSYDGKSVDYGSAEDLLARIRTIQREWRARYGNGLDQLRALIERIYQRRHASLRVECTTHKTEGGNLVFVEGAHGLPVGTRTRRR